MRKNKDGSPKEPGQQYDEVESAQRKRGRKRIRSVQGSKNRDNKELQELGREALKKIKPPHVDQVRGQDVP